jgi:hypothetical protein
MIGDARMRLRVPPATAILCGTILFALPSRTLAQTPAPRSTEVFGGYSFLRDPGNAILDASAGDDNFTLGWTAGLARPVWRAVAAVGEVSGHYKTRTTFDADVTLSFHAFLAGPRVAARIGPLTEFAQVLAGAVHGRGSAFGTTVSVTDLAAQPGGGVDYPLGARLAARLELDYRWIRGSDGRPSANQFRAVAALVYR